MSGSVFLVVATACSSATPLGSAEQAICNCNVPNPPCCCRSPILIDVAGDGFRLTSLADGVDFAPSHGARPSGTAWTEQGSDDAWLVFDRDGDGIINDGSEMFGSATPQPEAPVGMLRNGFAALAQYDDDHNGAIDAADEALADLRLWQDVNHDGISQPDELHALPELGVAGISLVYVEVREADQHGNSFRYRAEVYGSPGSAVGMTAWDVWLVGVTPELATRRDPPTNEPDPKEFMRCMKAANGTYEDWVAYCNSLLDAQDRATCFAEGKERSKEMRRGWCRAHWGSIVRCDQ